MKIKRGDIIYLKGEIPSTEHIQGFIRPYLVISNDIGNRTSEVVICVPLSRSAKRINFPTHTFLNFGKSICLCEQIFTIPQSFIERIAGHASYSEMKKVSMCLRKSLAV